MLISCGVKVWNVFYDTVLLEIQLYLFKSPITFISTV